MLRQQLLLKESRLKLDLKSLIAQPDYNTEIEDSLRNELDQVRAELEANPETRHEYEAQGRVV